MENIKLAFELGFKDSVKTADEEEIGGSMANINAFDIIESSRMDIPVEKIDLEGLNTDEKNSDN